MPPYEAIMKPRTPHEHSRKSGRRFYIGVAILMILSIAAVFFLPLSALHDKLTEGRVHPVSLWVPLLLVGSGLLFNAGIAPTASWRRFAVWLIQ